MLKELLAGNKPTHGKFVGFHRLDEATKKSNPMVARPINAKRRYKITITLKVGANKMWWQGTISAEDRNIAIEESRRVLQKDLIYTKSAGYSIEFIEALLIDKAHAQTQITSRG